MFCGFFGFLKIIAPGVGFEDDLFVSGVEVLHFICSLGDSLFQKKILLCFARGKIWSGLELTDTSEILFIQLQHYCENYRITRQTFKHDEKIWRIFVTTYECLKIVKLVGLGVQSAEQTSQLIVKLLPSLEVQ